MSTQTNQAPRHRRTLLLILGALVALALLVTLVVWQIGMSGASDDGAAAPPPSTPSGTASPSPSPSGTATPSPTGDPGEDGAGVPDQVHVDIDETAESAEGLSFRVTALEAVEGTADEPGEIAGPALRFTVEVTNSGSEPLPLRDVVVNVEHGADRAPAVELVQSETRPLPGEVPADSRRTGTYVFSVPLEERDDVRISVFTSVDAPTIVFSGAAPG